MTLPALHELGFGTGLTQHLLHHDPAALLGFRCQAPRHWRSSPIADRPITALWECGTTLVYFHQQTRRFEKCSLEDIDDVWISVDSAQGMLADLLIELYEDELSDDDMRSAAALLGFNHIERFLAEVAVNSRGAPYEAWCEAWREAFPLTCKG